MRRLTKKLMLVILAIISVSLTMAQNTSLVNESPATQDLINQQMLLERMAADQIIDMDANAKVTSIPSDELFDLQFEWPVGVGGGEAGIETDGNYIYTTKWNGADFYRYQMDGTYMESFTCGSASAIRDLAYDGTYFYGGAASTTVFEMDFDAQTLISSFTAPTDCRAIAYNEDDGLFYANNWGSAITAFDHTGAGAGSFPVGPVGDSYYGFAYESPSYAGNGPYLWGYAQVGNTLNELVQISLPDGTETGTYFDVGSILSANDIAGGMCIDDNLVSGFWTIMGTCQNINIWGVELAPSGPPLTDNVGVSAIVTPSSGVNLGSAEAVTITINNYGTAAQSNFDVDFTLDGGAAVTETITATINGGESYNHTFGTTVDLSAYGVYEFVACTYLAGDEDPDNDCKTKTVENSAPSLCPPIYTSGCSAGDGFTDFALEQIENYGSGCADLNGIGWSQYLGLGPAILFPGVTHDVVMGTGYANNFATIWIDFNDDLDLTPDEIVLNNYEMLAAGQLYTVTMDIPAAANPGTHIMRARTNWLATCDDPCASYSFGEAEDYMVSVGVPAYGILDGTVTEMGGGSIEGATITLVGTSYTTTTISNGTYEIIDVLVGDYTVECSKDGYNTETANVTIEENITTTLDFELTAPGVVVTPLTIAETLEPNAMTDVAVNISNPGSGTVDWSAVVFVESDNGTDDMFDLLFEWPVGVGGGEAGIETDGSYIYTTKWNGTDFYRYAMDGTYIESFTCGSANSVRDLAYDGTYFYGGAASTTVYEMDFDAQTTVSTFTAPTDCRAIAYNEDDDAFYANNWGSAITKFDKAGANLGSFAVGPVGDSYYGFAYDNYSDGAPYLWGYAQVGNTLNELVQISLPDGAETGTYFDVGSVLSANDIAGGLCIDDHLEAGLWAFMGTCQNINIWGLELCEAGPLWLSIDINSGSLGGGDDQDINVHLDATDLLPGVYVGQVQFSTDPNVGSPVVDVTLTVSGLIPPINLDGDYDCTDVELTWEMPSGGNPDSWNVYRDDVLIGTSTSMDYTDEMVDPEVEYSYKVAAVYGGDESQSTSPFLITVPTPVDLEILNLLGEGNIPNENDVTLTWDLPAACVAPDSYSIYRDGSMIASDITELTYVDAGMAAGYFEYYVVAVYYFGESDPSDPVYVLITGINNYDASLFQIFPNPATDLVNVKTPIEMTSIRVLNNLGQVVIDEVLNTQIFQIDVSQFESGIYYIKLETDEGSIVKKIAVE